MGILNITPDSFSDGGKYLDPDLAMEQVKSLMDQGVDIIDVGAESTGPGSLDVAEAEELKRLAPLLDRLLKSGLPSKTVFSIDTYKASVAEAALKAGFKMVNDVTALRGDPDMINVLLRYKPYVVLMYSKDATPRTTREAVQYEDVIETIKTFLNDRVQMLLRAGFPKENIILDPGMGAFVSSDPKYSFEIIERLGELKELGYPLLVGVSRKSFLGGALGDRDEASVKWSLQALKNGAGIVRLHNVVLFRRTSS